MKIGAHEVHDLAALLPLMEGKPFEELVADIREHGLREPVVLLPAIHRDPEMILDGRNRLRACLEAGRKPRFVYYRGSTDLASLIEYVRSQNLLRRHLSPTQIANAGLMYDDWYKAAAKSRMRNAGAIGGRSHPKGRADLRFPSAGPSKPKAPKKGSADLRSPSTGKSSAALAKDLGVSARTVENVRRARKLGTPEVVAAMASGELSADTAKDLVRLEHAEQDHALDESRRTGQSVRSVVKDKLTASGLTSKPAPDIESVRAAFDHFRALASTAAQALASARDAAVSAGAAQGALDDSLREFHELTARLVDRHRPERTCADCSGAGCVRCNDTGWLPKAGVEPPHLRLVSGSGDAE